MERQRKIVIIDDDPDVRWMLEKFLQKIGYKNEILQADNGLDGLKLVLTSDLPGLVITDCQMPGLTGEEVIKAVREIHSSLQLPIILVTGQRNFSPPDGCNYVLEKPLDLDKFEAVVSQFVPLTNKTHGVS